MAEAIELAGHGVVPASVMQSLKDGGSVLVVGGMNGNFSPEHEKHPQIIIWKNDNGGGGRYTSADIPASVKLVVFSRFISHAQHQNLMSQARARGIYYVRGVAGTGQIRKLLDQIPPPVDVGRSMSDLARLIPQPSPQPVTQPLSQPDDSTPAPSQEPDESMVKPRYTSMREYLRANGDVTVRPIALEAQRLFEGAQKLGLTRSLDSCRTEWATIVREARGAEEPEPVKPEPVKPEPARVEDAELAALLRLLDDARTALDMTREAIVAMASREARMREREARLKRLVAELGE